VDDLHLDQDPAVGSLQQDRPAILARVRLIEGCDEELGDQGREENGL
jgi:hypothetical protein